MSRTWVEAGVARAGNGCALIQALRELELGEELFCDYALPLELAEPCLSGAKTCRGSIVEPGVTVGVRRARGAAGAARPRRRS